MNKISSRMKKNHANNRKSVGKRTTDEIDIEEAISFVIERYGFDLGHVYVRPTWEGGLTENQILALFDFASKRRIEELDYNARLHGFKTNSSSNKKNNAEDISWGDGKYSECTLSDPASYEHLSDEDKQEFSKQMFSKYMRELGNFGRA